MTMQKCQQIRRRTLLELGRSAAGPRALGHAMLPRPSLVVGLAHGAPGGRNEMAAVILDEILAARPVLGVLDVEHRTDRFPAVVGVAVDLDLDKRIAGGPHAFGVLD